MPRVLLLHTGGTLGMKGTPLEPGEFGASVLEAVPEIAKLASLESRIISNVDSSDVGPEVWSELATSIAESYDDFDGFVITHGTDTMAYTASALSFALSGLSKPVILTGAQRPLSAVRTDARRNLADAVELATNDIPEVGICFDGLLLRGCKTTKSSARDYRGFTSPDCPPLARLGVDIHMGAHIRQPTREFACVSRFDNAVVFIQAIPGLDPGVLEAITRIPGLRGIVMAAFGTGTLPRSIRALVPVVEKAVESGLDVMITTSSSGKVDFGLYKNSLELEAAGAISGGSMRVEAAVTKMMHALAIHPDPLERRAYLQRDVAGENSDLA